jgi:transcriptional regulator GlxA family with amidase domain
MAATDQQSPSGQPDRPQVFVFLLLPDLSMMCLASAIEPLRSLNRLVRRQAYSWRLASLDGSVVEPSNGIPLATLPLKEALADADYLFVCGGLRIQPDKHEKQFHAALRKAARAGLVVGSLSTGTYLLARAGLLANHRCTIHWENRTAFREEFPDIQCTDRIYEIDRDRVTCAGGTAAMDMVLHFIAEKFGHELARDVANQFHHERIRDAQCDQRGSHREVLGHLPDKVREAITIMLHHIEEPLPIPEIARRVNVSPRHLERSFGRHLGTTPVAYYIQLRIEKARELLIYSDWPVIDVAVSTGFSSTTQMATWFRRVIGTTPTGLRERASKVAGHEELTIPRGFRIEKRVDSDLVARGRLPQ